MNIILGATGHVGTSVAENLLANNKPTLVVTRDPSKRREWEDKGAKVEVLDVLNTEKLHKLFKRGKRVFLLNPPGDPALDSTEEEMKTIRSILAAMEDVDLEKIVGESTYAAQKGDHLGDFGVLHEMEQGLNNRGIPNTIIRAAFYMSNWDRYLKMARTEHKIQSFYPETFKLPMVAPEDIGKLASKLMTEDARFTGVHYIEGPQRYSAIDVAKAFSYALGKPIRVERITRDQWVPYLLGMGYSQASAEALAALTEITLEGRYEKPLKFLRGTTTIDAYIEGLVRRQLH